MQNIVLKTEMFGRDFFRTDLHHDWYPQHWLGSQTSCLQEGLTLLLDCFLSACVIGTQATVISKPFRPSEMVRLLETYSNQGTFVQSAA